MKNTLQKALIILSTILGIMSYPNLMAKPCLRGYAFRLPIILDNTSSGGIAGIQLSFTVNTQALVASSKMLASGKDIRFLNSSGDTLPFHIELGSMNTTSTKIWLRKKTIRGYSMDTVYMYYGNASAKSGENPSQVFDVYEDFDGGTLKNQWDTCGTGSYSISSGEISLKSTKGRFFLVSKSVFANPGILEVEYSSSNKGEPILAQVNQFGDGYLLRQKSANICFEGNASGSQCANPFSIAQVSNSSLTGWWSISWPKAGNQEYNWAGKSKTTTNSKYQLSARQKLMVGVNGNASDLRIQHIRFRKSQAVGIKIGNEETTKFTIQPSYRKPLCENGDLALVVDSIVGAEYRWTGPNSFSSKAQQPIVTGVKSSDAGLYIVEVELPKGCASKTSSVNVTISPSAVGGSLSGTQTVCSGQNHGLLSLKGHMGNVQRWDSSTNGGLTWHPVVTSSLNRTYTNLKKNTQYRVLVINGLCSIDTSQIAQIIVSDSSLGGAVLNNDTVCYSNNSGVLSLSQHRGQILRWESSLNGNLWHTVVNRSSLHSYSGLTKTTHFRAVVKNGICAEKNSDLAKITVLPQAEGGLVTGSTKTCFGKNRTVLKAKNYVGSILHWESSHSGAGIWFKINNTSDSLVVVDLNQTTNYRVVVKIDSCQVDESTIATITIVNPASTGVLKGTKSVCQGFNSGSLALKIYWSD
jgi:hypothetical protein